MRLLILSSLVVLLIWAACPAHADVRVTDEENGRLTVHVDFGRGTLQTLDLPGMPALQFTRFFVAVPEQGRVRVRMAGGNSVDVRDNMPDIRESDPRWTEDLERFRDGGFYPAQPYRVSEPLVYRKTRVVAVDCYASQVDYGGGIHRRWSDLRVILEYPPAAKTLSASASDPLVAGLVVNRRFLPAPPSAQRVGRAAAAPDPHFALSSNWVKIRVDSTGIYGIQGSDLAAIGVNLQTINDPTTFRVFTLGGRVLPRSLKEASGTWLAGDWMTECDIIVDYGGDGTFDPTDRIVFYGLGLQEWDDLYSVEGNADLFRRHLYDKENIYFLTWDDNGGWPAAPGRMASAIAASGPGPTRRTFAERLHFEEDRVKDFNYGGDGWLWLEIAKGVGVTTRLLDSIVIHDLVLSQPQTFRTLAAARWEQGNNTNHHAEYLMNGVQIAEATWTTGSFENLEDAREVVVDGDFLAEGSNRVSLRVPRDLNANDFMLFAWYEVFYERRLRAVGDVLRFSSPDTTGALNFRVTDLGAMADPLYVLDVSDQFRPLRLTGYTETDAGGSREIEFGASLAGEPKHFAASTVGSLRDPVAIQRYFPTDIRDVTTSPHMVIVTDLSFMSAASRMQGHRSANLPYYANPVVGVVEQRHIFDNFSGGIKDPMAVRNYFKFLYDNFDDGGGNPLLTFVLLLGDANVDYRNLRDTQPDFVTTNLNLDPQHEAYETDDWFVLLDSTDTSGSSFIDVAIGRLPAATPSEAAFLVDKMIDYETMAEFGAWRDKIIYVSDDEKSPSTDNQGVFISQSEGLAHGFMAPFLDPVKVYLTEYPAISGIKPASRLAFLDAWNKGALLINYIGHGSSVQMADEQVFLAADVANLQNGLRLPLFMAFSCTIGNFANAQAKSLSEKLLLKENGGVIGTVTASQVTFIGSNGLLNSNLLVTMIPRDTLIQGMPPDTLGLYASLPEPLGVGLLKAKQKTLLVSPSRLLEENSQKYNLLSDPALRLHAPKHSIEFVESDIDTLTTGKRATIRGGIFLGGHFVDKPSVLDSTFTGRVELTVREPDDRSGYTRESDGYHIAYRYPGGTVYKGTANVTKGEFVFTFTVPRSADFGPLAFALAYADNGVIDAVTKMDRVVFVQPSASDSTVLEPADGPPRVALGFKSGEQVGYKRGVRTVKPGAVLQAQIDDRDGINILSTTPEGKMALVFDGSNLPLDVTEFFEFTHGGADTAGTLTFPLPDLPAGDHQVVLKVGDSFGQTRLDTLAFAVTDALDYSAEVVLNYPNPFETTTYFLLNLTGRADVRLDIFTVSGKRIRRLSETKDAGEAWILWDGRDTVGDEIANGTYLYVANVNFEGVDRPPLVLRGKVVKIK